MSSSESWFSIVFAYFLTKLKYLFSQDRGLPCDPSNNLWLQNWIQIPSYNDLNYIAGLEFCENPVCYLHRCLVTNIKNCNHSCARLLETYTCCYVSNFIKAVKFWTHLSFWDVLSRLWKWERCSTISDAECLIQGIPSFQHSHVNLGSSFWCWNMFWL